MLVCPVDGRPPIRFQLLSSAATVRTILSKYRSTPAALADACLISRAEERNSGDILTLRSTETD